MIISDWSYALTPAQAVFLRNPRCGKSSRQRYSSGIVLDLPDSRRDVTVFAAAPQEALTTR
jgi:hypothetical protein